ncbi:MAG: hypothetical protein KDD82_22945 [Planctomycetes bacterium]|nr:hypothetical protein [Planctomycetota bacterium]
MKPKQQPSEPPRPRTDLGVEVSANRCPYCHEGVEAAESLACQGCLARHHAPCWREGGERCAACGHDAALVDARRAPGSFPAHALNSIFFGFTLFVAMPLVLWLKLAHGIDRIGPVPALGLPFGLLLLGSWLTFALNFKRTPPQRRRVLLALIVGATLLILAGLIVASLP